MLSDRSSYGQHFLNVIMIKSHHLMRHMVAAFLIERKIDALIEIALPII